MCHARIHASGLGESILEMRHIGWNVAGSEAAVVKGQTCGVGRGYNHDLERQRICSLQISSWRSGGGRKEHW